MLDSPLPLSFVKVSSLFSAVTMNDVVFPVSIVHPSIDIVKNSLPIFLSVSHVPLISLSVGGDEDALPRSHVVLPLSQVDFSIGLKNANSVLLIVPQLTLIHLFRRVLDHMHIFQELSVGVVDVVMQEGTDVAVFLLFQASGVD